MTFRLFFLFFAVFSQFVYSEFNEIAFEETKNEREPIEISLITDDASIQPGHPITVALRFAADEGWHAYWKNPGDAGMAPEINWTLPEGFTVLDVHWPAPRKHSDKGSTTFFLEDTTHLVAEIMPPNSIDSKEARIVASVNWVMCSSSTCLPGFTESSMTLPVDSNDPKPDHSMAKEMENARAKLPKKTTVHEIVRKGDLLLLQIDTPKTYGSVQFFPEEERVIQKEEVATLTPSNFGLSTLVLRAETAERKPLKGVIAILDPLDENKMLESFFIDTSLPEGGTKEIAYLDNVASSTSIAAPSFAITLFFAFIGGMILNLMPCVLPVISFKVLGFVKMAGQNRKTTFLHGIAFSLGVLLSFWAIAAILLVLRSYGEAVGWGFQLQDPTFVAILSAIILVFGLSLFGVFEFGLVFTNIAAEAETYAKAKPQGLTSSFLSGVLATMVATPCTGPFLGVAVGLAVTLPPILSLIVFTAIGLGMALPYLILTGFPALLHFLPKPGPWMESFKQLMGFLMLATVLWLLWVFGAQTNTMGLTYLLFGLLILSFSCWVYGHWNSPRRRRTTRQMGALMALLLFIFGLYVIWTADDLSRLHGAQNSEELISESGWIPFNREKLDELRKNNVPVFVDFTAKWCLICQTNHLVLTRGSVEKKMEELGVVKMVADWTRNDPQITEELRKFGRSGVPLYLVYGNEEQPQILPQVLTPDIVLEALNNVSQK